jgi:hypothetical protein
MITQIQAFGANSTFVNGILTINFNDLETSTGLDDANLASPSQQIATLLRYWQLQTDWSSNATAGVAPGLTQSKQVVTLRGTTAVTQISRPITINCYENDNQAVFDPDNVI